MNLGASLVVGTRLDRKFAREIDGKLLEKQVKTPPNTSLMPPPKKRKLRINHPDLTKFKSFKYYAQTLILVTFLLVNSFWFFGHNS